MAAADRRETERLLKQSYADAFKKKEATRPEWDASATASATAATAAHRSIDPDATGRSPMDNYKLCISGIVPRPIAFLSTQARDGSSANLAPMSFFQFVNVDPLYFVVGITSSLAGAKDTLRNLIDTNECVINVVSEGVVEAVNATSIDAPYGTSEWDISGLTPVLDCKTVSCARVQECIFSIEAKVDNIREFESHSRPGVKTGCLVTLGATHFWARENAINEQGSNLDLSVRGTLPLLPSSYFCYSRQILRPMSRLGGMIYGRTTQAIELPRPSFKEDLDTTGLDNLEKKAGTKPRNIISSC